MRVGLGRVIPTCCIAASMCLQSRGAVLLPNASSGIYGSKPTQKSTRKP